MNDVNSGVQDTLFDFFLPYINVANTTTTKEEKFSNLKPGDKFGITRTNPLSCIKLKGHVLTAVPDEEIGEDYYNTLYLSNADLIFLEPDTIVYV